MNINSIKTPEQFCQEIEDLVWDKDITYWDAVQLYIEQNQIEVEVVASLIKQNTAIKARLAVECQQLNLIEKAAKLLV